jgi:hypothetical protein
LRRCWRGRFYWGDDGEPVLQKGLVNSTANADISGMNKALVRTQTFKDLVQDARAIGVPPEEVRQIQKVVKNHRFPADVQAVEVNFGRDWTGAPAAWIRFRVEDDVNPSEQKIARLNKFANSIRDALLKTYPTYWPYIDFHATP